MLRKQVVITCRYCDGGRPTFPYGKDESCHCSNCGAEWEPIKVEEEFEDEC